MSHVIYDVVLTFLSLKNMADDMMIPAHANTSQFEIQQTNKLHHFLNGREL